MTKPEPIIVPINVTTRHPLRMLVKPDVDLFISKILATEGCWERYNTALLQSLLCEGDCFLDLGANLGYFSLLAADCVTKAGRVFAFEPDPENHWFCEQNIDLNQLRDVISLHRIGIGDRQELQTLFRSESNHGAHQLAHQIRDGFENNGSPVEVMSLDQFAGTHSELSRVDVIKMDVQGYETKALHGMSELVARNRNWLVLLVEFSPTLLKPFDDEGAGLEAFYQFIENDVECVFRVDRNKPASADVAVVPVSTAQLRVQAAELISWSEEFDVDMCLDLMCVFSQSGLASLTKKLARQVNLPSVLVRCK